MFQSFIGRIKLIHKRHFVHKTRQKAIHNEMFHKWTLSGQRTVAHSSTSSRVESHSPQPTEFSTYLSMLALFIKAWNTRVDASVLYVLCFWYVKNLSDICLIYLAIASNLIESTPTISYDLNSCTYK